MADRFSHSYHCVAPTLNDKALIDLNASPEEQIELPREKSHDDKESNLKLNQGGSHEFVGHESVGDIGMYNETLYHAEGQMKIGSMLETAPATVMLQQLTKMGPRTRKGCTALVLRPDWLPLDWGFTWKVRTAGKTAGNTDKYFFSPSGLKFRSKVEVLEFLETGSRRKRKLKSDANATPSDGPSDQRKKTSKQASGNPSDHQKKKSKSNIRDFSDMKFDFRNPPRSLTWVQANDCPDDWLPTFSNATVPKSERTEWGNVYSRVTQLDKTNGAS